MTQGVTSQSAEPSKEVLRLARCRPADLAIAMRLATVQELTDAAEYARKNKLLFRVARLEAELAERKRT